MSYLKFEPTTATKWNVTRDGAIVGSVTKENGTSIFLTQTLQHFCAEDLSSIRLFMVSGIGAAACASR
jgi:hypothetical protein